MYFKRIIQNKFQISINIQLAKIMENQIINELYKTTIIIYVKYNFLMIDFQ